MVIMLKKWILKTYCGGIEPSAPLAGPHSCSSTGQQRLHLGGGGALEEGRGALEGALEGGGDGRCLFDRLSGRRWIWIKGLLRQPLRSRAQSHIDNTQRRGDIIR